MVEVFKRIVRGFYPELTMNPNLNSHNFYADYVDTYIERDVSDLINVKDKFFLPAISGIACLLNRAGARLR